MWQSIRGRWLPSLSRQPSHPRAISQTLLRSSFSVIGFHLLDRPPLKPVELAEPFPLPLLVLDPLTVLWAVALLLPLDVFAEAALR